MLTAGTLGDRFGRRKLFPFGRAVFMLGSALRVAQRVRRHEAVVRGLELDRAA